MATVGKSLAEVDLVEIPEVFHVGDLDTAARTARASLEAFMLSVSEFPEDWERIARCAGRHWTLTCAGASWLDASSLTGDQVAQIAAWGVKRGHAVPARLWRAWSLDTEAETWGYSDFCDRTSALAQIDQEAGADGVPSANGRLLEPVRSLVLTDEGMTALERWHDRTGALEGLVILWAREVLQHDVPALVGVWWDEVHDPDILSCPRGGIFPEKLDLFEIVDDFGALPPIRQLRDGVPEP